MLAGLVSFLPQDVLQGPSNPQPSSTSDFTVNSVPTAQAMRTTALDSSLLSILFGIAALVVGVIIACLFFSERSFQK
jgi:hypothetical protein